MGLSVLETELIKLLRRAQDDYKALERNEAPCETTERERFMTGIAQAIAVIERRATRRDAK